MKVPSITYLIEHAKKAFLRSPFTLLSAFLAVSISIYLVEYWDDISNLFPYVNLLLTAALAVPLFFSVSILLENRYYSLLKKVASYSITLLLLVAIYYSLPDSEITNNTHVPYIRYVLFNLIAHLIVSFIPYLKTAQLNGFWNYNKTLFLRFCTSVLYSFFLYTGITLALTSLNLLFDIDLHEELYIEIFIFIIGVFNTWFFVAGIPDNLEELDTVKTYPRGLKIFTQYVLLPLLLLYLFILYVYGAKILFLNDWPKGIVAYLISGVSSLGVFTLLLIHPYGKLEGNAWIKKFTSIYYYLLFPLILFLFVAISIRINDYGVSINRYIIVLLGIWLSLISVYFSIRKTNIKFIPISLAVILGLMSFGPWGMFATSERSQVQRLKNYLEQSGILVNSSIQNEPVWTLDSNNLQLKTNSEFLNDEKISDSLHNEILSIVDYLDNSHGFESIRSWFYQDIDSLYKRSLDSNRYLNEAQVYMESMGLEYQYYSKSKKSSQEVNISSMQSNVKQISGYDLFTSFNLRTVHYDRNPIESFPINESIICVDLVDHTSSNLKVQYNETSFVFQLDTLLQQSYLDNEKTRIENARHKPVDINPKKMTFIQQNENLKVKLIISHLNFFKENDSLKLNQISGDLYLQLTKE